MSDQIVNIDDLTQLTELDPEDFLMGIDVSQVDPELASIIIKLKNITKNLALVPSGVVQSWLTGSAPSGYTICNGDSFDTTAQAGLFAVIGYTFGGSGSNFNVPDFRGLFLRGAGEHGSMLKADGNPFDGGAVADENDDKMQGHRHNYIKEPNATADNSGGFQYDNMVGTPTGTVANRVLDPIADPSNGTPRTGDETAPANIAINWIIKL